jgi:hypothetical protein
VLDEGIPGWVQHGFPTEGQQAEGLPIPDYGAVTSHWPAPATAPPSGSTP